MKIITRNELLIKIVNISLLWGISKVLKYYAIKILYYKIIGKLALTLLAL